MEDDGVDDLHMMAVVNMATTLTVVMRSCHSVMVLIHIASVFVLW